MIPKIKNCTCNYQELILLGFPAKGVMHSSTCKHGEKPVKKRNLDKRLGEIFDIIKEI